MKHSSACWLLHDGLFCLAYSSTLKMEVTCSSEMSMGFQLTTQQATYRLCALLSLLFTGRGRHFPGGRPTGPRVHLCLYIMFTSLYGAIMSPDSAVGIATRYGLDDWGVGVRVPLGSRIFSFNVFQTSSGVHPVSYPMGTGGFLPSSKAAGAWSWPLTSN
jgi:hypothetical protein